MSTGVKMIFLFLLLVLAACMGSEPVSDSTQANSGLHYLPATSDSSCQLTSMQEGVKLGTNASLESSYRRGEMELAEKTTSQTTGHNSLRVRKSSDVSFFFKNIMQQLSFRTELLAQDQGKLFHSNYNHSILSSSQYYVYMLRHIII